MLGVTRDILEEELASMRGVEDFFSVARTMPLAALMPREVTPWLTALRAYSVAREHVSRWDGEEWYVYLSVPACRCYDVSDATSYARLYIIPGRECGEREGVSVGHGGPLLSVRLRSVDELVLAESMEK